MYGAPRCSNCGAPWDGGEHREGEAERDTGYREDEWICRLCLEEEGRWDAADAAYDLQNEGD
jgi:hypothetical protein